ncbi:hypothetical protein [Cupriavidus basilensis]|uniref:hypothetical protein n=1 Tax=Cupriavidus basilensis TaxID=68895 RepID=UPI00157B9693|nr:hypothetical protein [Cupriavidus basilensis]NUA30268.1 hypothetical protein [Cupriavidus basilensis]
MDVSADAFGTFWPIEDGEVLGAHVARMSQGMFDGEAKRRLADLVEKPLLPHGVTESLAAVPGALNALDIALRHTHLRWYTVFAPTALARMIADDVLHADSVLRRWAVPDTTSVRHANQRAPGMCPACAMKQRKAGVVPFWTLLAATPGYEVCLDDGSPILHACDDCARDPLIEKFSHEPQRTCYCGAKRQRRKLSRNADFTRGVAEDIRDLLSGMLDSYLAEEILMAMRERAGELKLVGENAEKKTKELLAPFQVGAYLQMVYRTPFHASLMLAMQGRRLSPTPLLNVIAIRALFGSLAGMKAVLDATIGTDGRCATSRAWPAYLDEVEPDRGRLAKILAVFDWLVEHGRVATMQDAAGAFAAEFNVALAYTESHVKATLDGYWGTKSSVPDGVDDIASAQAVALRATEMMSQPDHPRRTIGVLLGTVMHPVTYSRRKDILPELEKVVGRYYETKDQYHRRLYSHLANTEPERLGPGMPRSRTAIARASAANVRDWLKELGVRIQSGF